MRCVKKMSLEKCNKIESTQRGLVLLDQDAHRHLREIRVITIHKEVFHICRDEMTVGARPHSPKFCVQNMFVSGSNLSRDFTQQMFNQRSFCLQRGMALGLTWPSGWCVLKWVCSSLSSVRTSICREGASSLYACFSCRRSPAFTNWTWTANRS